MLAALIPCHSHFNRKASLTAEPFTPGWSLAISIVLLGSLWLGFFAYKHVDYSRDLWWHFTLFGNAPRFLRASVGVVAVALGVAVSRLMRAAPMEPSTPTEEELGKASAVAAAFPRPPPPHLRLARPDRRQAAPLPRRRRRLRDVRRRAPDLGVDGRPRGPGPRARRAGVEVPRAGRPPPTAGPASTRSTTRACTSTPTSA